LPDMASGIGSQLAHLHDKVQIGQPLPLPIPGLVRRSLYTCLRAPHSYIVGGFNHFRPEFSRETGKFAERLRILPDDDPKPL
jgi:hypothetical protein